MLERAREAGHTLNQCDPGAFAWHQPGASCRNSVAATRAASGLSAGCVRNWTFPDRQETRRDKARRPLRIPADRKRCRQGSWPRRARCSGKQARRRAHTDSQGAAGRWPEADQQHSVKGSQRRCRGRLISLFRGSSPPQLPGLTNGPLTARAKPTTPPAGKLRWGGPRFAATATLLVHTVPKRFAALSLACCS